MARAIHSDVIFLRGTIELDVHIRPSHFTVSLPLVDHQRRRRRRRRKKMETLTNTDLSAFKRKYMKRVAKADITSCTSATDKNNLHDSLVYGPDERMRQPARARVR